MILSDDEIKGLVFFDGKAAIYRSIETICTSHLEANARIRELEAQVQEWHERYVICCEDSRLEKEALRNELIEANANIDRWFRDHQKLSEAFIRQCDRADRLAVIADALAEHIETMEYMFDKAVDNEATEAKLRELVKAAEEKDRIENLKEPGHFPNPENRYAFQDTKFRAWDRYQAALKAAKGGDEMSKIVMYDSDEAATYRHNIGGWVDRHGVFCGKDEDLARYRGCTHRPCSKCGKPVPKSYTVCDECRRKAEIEKYEALERKRPSLFGCP